MPEIETLPLPEALRAVLAHNEADHRAEPITAAELPDPIAFQCQCGWRVNILLRAGT
jgi:hypothetical protein